MVSMFVLAAAVAALPLPPVTAPPAWVEAVELPSVEGEPGGSTRVLLEDTQVRAGKVLEVYERRVWKVLSQTGVEELARQELEWDPSWQQLELHGVWLHRKGERRVAWHPEDARVIQRESELAEGLYDGRLTLVLELRDVREGDVVELAWTHRGENPVFGGRFAFNAWQAWGQPLERAHFRLIWDRPRPLRLVAHGDAVAPTSTTEGGKPTWRWDLTKVAARHFEEQTPADVEPGAWVEFSDWEDWAEVSRWALALFDQPAGGARFDEELARFKALPPAERATAIVRFVQDDVRYVGVELGQHSHQPHPPAWVLERGFGDCKDKALLLTAFLRAAGLEAWPALVHASAGLEVPSRLPSPSAFDHAIVQLALPTGSRFIDGTWSLQRGPVEASPSPGYHHALLVKAGTTALTPMPPEPLAAPSWELEQHWRLPRLGAKASLTVTTTARGIDATTLRRRVKSETQEELRRSLHRFREERLELKLAPRALRWTDDEAGDVVTVVEDYEVADFFVDGLHQFDTLAVAADFQPLDEHDRAWPFELHYPLRTREVIRYDAPDTQRVSDYQLTNRVIRHPAFELRVAQGLVGNRLTLEWELLTLKDRVEPREAASYRAQWKAANDVLGYQVASSTAVRGRSSDGQGLLVLLVLLLGVMAGLFVLGRVRVWWGGRRVAAFKARQRSQPGELAAEPAVVSSLDAGARLFTSRSCPLGHGWGEVAMSDTVRLGDERVTVLSRTCSACTAREHRYVKVPLQ